MRIALKMLKRLNGLLWDVPLTMEPAAAPYNPAAPSPKILNARCQSGTTGSHKRKRFSGRLGLRDTRILEEGVYRCLPMEAALRRSESRLKREPKKTRSGAKAAANAAVHRAMREQSLRVPWRDLAAACDRMIEWRSFILWVRAIISAEETLPDWLRDRIDQRCPGFLDGRPKPSDHDSLWVDLSGWVNEHCFTSTLQGGWLDALHFYSGRDPRSERAWNQWTHADSEWRDCQPQAYPSFEQWYQEALNNCAAADDNLALAPLVKDYIEWEAFAFWSRAIVESAGEIPGHLISVLQQRCPGFADHIRRQPARAAFSTRFWKELLAWIEDHIFSEAKTDSRLDAIRSASRTHLRGERIAAYWADCSSRWAKAPPNAYPSFEDWLRGADGFVIR